MAQRAHPPAARLGAVRTQICASARGCGAHLEAHVWRSWQHRPDSPEAARVLLDLWGALDILRGVAADVLPHSPGELHFLPPGTLQAQITSEIICAALLGCPSGGG